ncbi:hypothetical protein BGZ68_004500 [Mortierella alpina]|nr:hypothetical protein BGZ68_004500 [Mortierella alpina]
MNPTASTTPKKVIVITGGNVGIGFQAAKLILSTSSNVHVVLGCHDHERATAGVKSLEAFAANSNTIEFRPLELASFASVRQFGESVVASFPYGIHTLVLNAGVMVFKRELTADDGHEYSMQVNHLSQLLLTQLLLPSLRNGHKTWPEEKPTVLFVSSDLHKPGVGKGKGPILTLENINDTEGFDGMVAYRNSKLCQLLCMHVLATQLKDDVVTVNAVSPGFVPTSGLKRHSGFATRLLMDNVLSRISAASTEEEGGRRVFNAMSGERRNGNAIYYDKDVVGETSEESKDPEKQKFWWDWSCRAVGLESLAQQ